MWSAAKDLLLLLMTTLVPHLSAFPTGDTRTALEMALCNLVKAQEDYVRHIFNGHPPRNDALKVLEGITLPVVNTSAEVQASVCSISDYLDNHLPSIVRKLSQQHTDELLANVKAFHIQFRAVLEWAAQRQNATVVLRRCHRKLLTSHGYELKIRGLQIIYSARQWVEGFTNSHHDCA